MTDDKLDLEELEQLKQEAAWATGQEASCEMGSGNYGLCKTHPTCEAVRARIAELERQAEADEDLHKKAVYCSTFHCDCNESDAVRELLAVRSGKEKP